MDNTSDQNQPQVQHPQTDDAKESAVPYTPQVPQVPNTQKYFRYPAMNAFIIVVVVLLGGFMTYNFVGHQLTRLAGDSAVKVISPTPSVSPTPTIYQPK